MNKSKVCHLIKTTPSILDLLPTKDRFHLVKTYEYESHLFRYLLSCKKCGQLFFFEFNEEIDWEGGDDTQYTTYIPVSSVEQADSLHAKSPLELLVVKPRIQYDTGKGTDGIIKWIR